MKKTAFKHGRVEVYAKHFPSVLRILGLNDRNEKFGGTFPNSCPSFFSGKAVCHIMLILDK